jgi:hypothetical protein
MVRRATDPVTQFLRAKGSRPSHRFKRLRNVGRRSVRQAGDNRTACEQFRVAGKHDRGHRAPCGKTGHEYARQVGTIYIHHRHDHLANGQRLAPIAAVVGGREPVETKTGVVCALLLWKQQQEAMFIC